jgi:hypothetical protein
MKKNILILFILVLVKPVLADSDGYACWGKNYIAFEESGFDTDGKHRLFIVRLDDKYGIGPEISVEMDNFQVHGMIGEDTRILLLTYDKVYEVDVSDPGNPKYNGEIQVSNIKELQKKSTQFNIGHWSSQQELLLPASGKNGMNFTLSISKFSKIWPGIVERTTITKIIQKDKDGNLVNSRIIFAGIFHETVD